MKTRQRLLQYCTVNKSKTGMLFIPHTVQNLPELSSEEMVKRVQ